MLHSKNVHTPQVHVIPCTRDMHAPLMVLTCVVDKSPQSIHCIRQPTKLFLIHVQTYS